MCHEAHEVFDLSGSTERRTTFVILVPFVA
jgi:hypothetical protein